MLRRLIAPLVPIVFVASAGMAWAQNAFPAPLPGPQATPPVGTWSAPLANGAALGFGPPPDNSSQACRDFQHLLKRRSAAEA